MLTSFTIRTKIVFGQAILTILLLILSVISYQTLATLQHNTDIFAGHLLKAQGVVLNADRDLYQALTAQHEYLQMGANRSNSQKLRADFDENSQQAADRMMSFLSSMSAYPEVTAKFGDFKTDFEAWKSGALQVFSLVDAGQQDAAVAKTIATMPVFQKVRDYYNLGTDDLEAIATSTQEESSKVANSRQWLTILLSAGAILIGILLTWQLPKIIINSINLVHDKIEDISRGEGDLVSRIPITSQDELGALAGSVNQFLNKLQTLIREIQQNANTLDVSTNELHDISEQSDRLTHKQRQELDSLVTAFTEINHAVRDIAQHAQSAAHQTEEAQKGTQQGIVLLQRNVENSQLLSMSVNEASSMIMKLAEESEKITSVLDVIRGIAEQTNLLALNAAIEAARAGEQGRGFAVVADEVRTLASRTQKSTADIQQMISSLKSGVNNAVTAMEKGSSQMADTLDMVNEASSVLNNIQSVISQASDMTFQIAAATEQQSTVVEAINHSLTDLNQATRQQATLATQTSSAGNDIVKMAHRLRQLLGQFRV
jgi:methyl-accepting chemotaxis protein